MPTRFAPLARVALLLVGAGALLWWREAARAHTLEVRTRHRLAPTGEEA